MSKPRFNIFFTLFMLFLILGAMMSCANSANSENVKPGLSFIKPDHFPAPTYTFDNNPVTLEKYQLGKKLFFDQNLSRDRSVSCASCHVQTVAFADPQHRLSIGIEDQIGSRNAPPIMNLAFMNSFFWDGGVRHMDFISINPIENPVEMGEDIGLIVDRLNESSAYSALFSEAYATDSVTTPHLLQALSQFMIQLVSANSKYDQFILGEQEALTALEKEGLAIFEEKCAECHSGALFTDQSFRNTGLDSMSGQDVGREGITQNIADRGKFKVPSLRNIEFTSPYMHDGRFKTLSEVLEHYDEGVLSVPNLDSTLISEDRLGIELSENEKARLIDFLMTLTDDEFLSNPFFRR